MSQNSQAKKIQIRHPKLLRFVRWSVPTVFLLLILFLTTVLLVENHAGSFYNRIGGGGFKNYLLDSEAGALQWSVTGLHNFSVAYLLFMRFVFNLHLVIVQGINVLFNLHKSAPRLADLGSYQFDLLVIGNALFDLVLFSAIGCLLRRQRSSRTVKVIGWLFLTFSLALFGGLFALIIVFNGLLAQKGDPFLANQKLVVARSLQNRWPLFGFVPVFLVLFLFIDWILLLIVCLRYRRQPVPTTNAKSTIKRTKSTVKTKNNGKQTSRPLMPNSSANSPNQKRPAVAVSNNDRSKMKKPLVSRQKGLIAKVPVMKPARLSKN